MRLPSARRLADRTGRIGCCCCCTQGNDQHVAGRGPDLMAWQITDVRDGAQVRPPRAKWLNIAHSGCSSGFGRVSVVEVNKWLNASTRPRGQAQRRADSGTHVPSGTSTKVPIPHMCVVLDSWRHHVAHARTGVTRGSASHHPCLPVMGAHTRHPRSNPLAGTAHSL